MTPISHITLSVPNGVPVTIPRHIVDKGGYIRCAEWADVPYLVDNLRPEDKKEIKSASGMEAEDGIRTAVDIGALVGTNDEGPWVIWGHIPSTSDMTSVWCLATDQLAEHRSGFLRVSKLWLDALPYQRINCFTDSRNKEHHRWLKFMRFKRIGEPKYFYDPTVEFHEYIRKDIL